MKKFYCAMLLSCAVSNSNAMDMPGELLGGFGAFLKAMGTLVEHSGPGSTTIHLTGFNGGLNASDLKQWEQENPSKKTIIDAIKAKNPDLLKAFIDSNGETLDFAHPDRAIGTPLGFAASKGDMPLLEYMLTLADVNLGDKVSNTPLMRAAQTNQLKAVEKLLECGAAVTKVGSSKQSALALAILNKSNKVLKPLIDAGSSLDTVDSNGETPLITAIRKNNLIGAAALCKAGAEVNLMTPESNHSALIVAAMNNKTAFIELLTENDSLNLDIKCNTCKATALCHAIYKGYEAAVRALVEKGALVNEPSENGDTPTHIAVTKRNSGILSFLAPLADLTLKNKKLQTPLAIAQAKNWEDGIFILKQYAGSETSTEGSSE